MGKKKKGKKKKKKKGGGGGGGAESQELIPFPADTRRYVHVSMHMQNWPHAERLWPKGGFWLETSTRLFYLHKMIKRRHGAVQNIRLWKNARVQDNLLLGDMITLQELGFEGEVKPEDRPTTDPLKPPSTADSSATGEGGEENDGGDDAGVLFEDGMVVEPGVETRNNEDKMEDDGAFAAEAVEAEDNFTHFKFIYDFTPAQLDDPLLLISPR